MNSFKPSRILSYFFQGLVILAPIVITGWAVVSLFNFIDGILPNLLRVLFPDLVRVNEQGNPEKIPGLGFLVVVVLVLLVGYISSLFFVSRFVSFFDQLLEKTPGIKIIYSTVKDFLEAFAGNKRKFDKPVLVQLDKQNNLHRIGFAMSADLKDLDLEDMIVVYFPQSYAFAGDHYLVHRDTVKPLNISSTAAMKFIVSGGVSGLKDN